MERLAHWPLLRQLKAERRFRYVFALAAVIVIVISLALPRIWIITPKGLYPIIRIRGIDFIEAAIFRKIALAKEADGDRPSAWQYWRQACAHNPRSTELLRSAVSNLWHLPSRDFEYFSDGMGKAAALIALDRSNSISIYYAARTYSHFRFYNLVVKLAAEAPYVSPETAQLAVQARLLMGDEAGYLRGRQSLGSSATAPGIQLFDWAHAAAWSSDSIQASEGRRQLLRAAAESDPETRATAQRLILIASSERTDAGLFEQTLQALHDEHNDEPLQHVQLWHLLETTGQKDRAVAEAKKAELVPISSTEMLGVAEAFERLGLSQQSLDYLERYAFEIKANPEVWLHYTDLLIAQRLWDDLRKAAVDIRRCPSTRQELAGYSHFLEGLALKATGANQDAEANFRKVLQFSIPRPNLALLVAAKMAELGCPEPALQLALQQEASLSKRPEYWSLLINLAGLQKDPAQLLRAAENGYALDPKNPLFISNYISALIIQEASPDLLLDLAGRLSRQFPDSLAAKVDLAFALILNHRTNDAEGVIITLPAQEYSPREKSMIALARGRLGSLQHNWAFAFTNYSQVDVTTLFPAQADKMIRLREEAAVEMDRAGTRNQVP